MTAKEFVLNKYPKARAYRQTTRGFNACHYYLIFEGYYSARPIRLNDGEGCNTESKAWTQAKKEIMEAQKTS